jgi:hypothetical protein
MFDLELGACSFGKSPPKERSEARTARVLQQQQQGIDARAIRLRRSRLARGSVRSDTLGAAEGLSLGAGL